MVTLSQMKKTKKLPSKQMMNGNNEGLAASKKLMIISQEVNFVRSLACNDLNKRNRQLRKLKTWFKLRSRSSFSFTDEDYMRIWTGLYYTMWMSDKPLVQEELAEQLGELLDCFNGNVELSVNFFGAFLRTMCREFFGLDQWRIDKFLMLVRRMLRSMFRVLKNTDWTQKHIQNLNKRLKETVLADEVASVGLTMHILDIYLEELAKVSEGNIPSEKVNILLVPFIDFLITQRDLKLVAHCRKSVLNHLLYQSALGREYSEKYAAWKQMGFPTKSIHDLERVENDEENDEEMEDSSPSEKMNHLDPRAGNVDVFMPELLFDASKIISEFQSIMYKPIISTKCRKMLKKIVEHLQKYEKGEFPLGEKSIPRLEMERQKPLIKDKIEKLENLENELFGTGRKLKKLNKRIRRKLLKSLNYDNVDEDNFDAVIAAAIPKDIPKNKFYKPTQDDWIEEEIPKSEIALITSKMSNQSKEKNLLKKHKNSKVSENTPKLKQINTQHKTEQEPKTNELGWEKPLEEGEVEYFIPSRKLQIKSANKKLVPNPLALKLAQTPLKRLQHQLKSASTSNTPVKRVKIVLKHNTAQNPIDYINQIKSSPNLPYDANKKPGKGLLKPNSMPSPINPFYKKKFGLHLNDTL